MSYEEILYAAEGPIGYLTLNNPEKVNVLSKNMIGEIIHALDKIAKDESKRKDAQNGIDSFLNKRAPAWKDR